MTEEQKRVANKACDELIATTNALMVDIANGDDAEIEMGLESIEDWIDKIRVALGK